MAILLAAGMVLAAAGCGSKDAGKDASKDTQSTVKESTSVVDSTTETPEPKDPVTICYYYMNGVGEQEYTKQVEEKLNEMLHGMEGYEHISIELHPSKDYATDFTLAQASGAQIDLISLYGLDYYKMLANEDLIALDDLVAGHPDAVAELPDWLVDYGKADGKQYYIPTYQQATYMNFVKIPTEYLEMYYTATGKTEADVYEAFRSCDPDKMCDFFEELLLAVREGTGKDTKWLQPFPGNASYMFNNETLSDYGSIVIPEGKAPEYFRTSEWYKTLCGRLAMWYKEGYIHPDFQTYEANVYKGNNMLNDEAVVIDWAQNACSEEYLEDQLEIDVKAFAMRDHAYIGSTYAARGNAIYAECEHPEEAMMLIALLNSQKGKEFYNTLVWGLEGTHWEWEDQADERIKTLEYDGSQGGSTSTYHAWKWNTGNTFNAWKNQAVTDGFNEYIKENLHDAPSTVVSPLIGITWDVSGVSDQIAQCKAVESEYTIQSIIAAGDGWEARYDEFVKKLEAAGVQKIMDVVTQQYNDFLKSN